MRREISLAGTWLVRPAGEEETTPCSLPGTLEESGIGGPDEEGLTTRLTRTHVFTGTAVYERKVQLPETDGCLLLCVERSRELHLLADGKEIPALIPGTLSTPYVFDVTPLAGREVLLSLEVDNRYAGWPRQAILDSSAATDETQTNWNGILGAFCLAETGKTSILGARILTRGKKADLSVRLHARNGSIKGLSLLVTSDAMEEKELPLADGNKEQVFSGIPLLPDAGTWSPFHPVFHDLTLTLKRGSEVLDVRTIRFGIRDFSAEGSRLACNGHEIFLRGEANCCVFPKTGHPPMEKKEWIEVLDRFRAYGVNTMRFHSWCPPEAAFAAADELGMFLQPELSMWDHETAMESGEAYRYYHQELFDILWTYGSHPSFVMLTLGNELNENTAATQRMEGMLREAKAFDPTRLYSIASNWKYGAEGCSRESDFYASQSNRGRTMRATSSPMTGHLNEEAPDTLHHYDEAVSDITDAGKPVFGFEVGQYESWPDLAQTEEYTGITRAENIACIRDLAEKTGAIRYWDQGMEATGRLALWCYKEEVEAVLRSEKMSGLSLLGLQDFPGQGTALVGMMDSCLRQKKGTFSDPARFHSFFDDVVPIAEFPSYTYTEGDVLEGSLFLAQYSERDLSGTFAYSLLCGSTLIEGGEAKPHTFPCGKLCHAGDFRIPLPETGEARKYVLKLTFLGKTNQYPIYVYPKQSALPEEVLVLNRVTREDLVQIRAGRSAVIDLAPTEENYPDSIQNHFTTDFWTTGTFPEQSGTMGLLIDDRHPALRDFPTDFYSGPQWWAPSSGRAMLLGTDEVPVIRVLDHVTKLRNLGCLVEYRLGKGRILLSSMGLSANAARPECRYLLECLVWYESGTAAGGIREITEDQLAERIRISE